jgi:hypothetical protein
VPSGETWHSFSIGYAWRKNYVVQTQSHNVPNSIVSVPLIP